MTSKERKNLFIRKGKLGEVDEKALDYEYWAQQSDQAKFEAAWELVVMAHEIKGLDPDELRLKRSVTKLGKFPR